MKTINPPHIGALRTLEDAFRNVQKRANKAEGEVNCQQLKAVLTQPSH